MSYSPTDSTSSRYVPPGLRGKRTDSASSRYLPPGMRGKRVQQQLNLEDDCRDDNRVDWEPAKASQSLGMLTTEEPRDTDLEGMDRLVQDLLDSRKHLEAEKKRAVDQEAEIARLREQVARLQQRDSKGCKDCTDGKEVEELRRLLDFHKTNGEQVSRQFRDLQATNRNLQTRLQAAETALEEQMSLLSSLGGKHMRR